MESLNQTVDQSPTFWVQSAAGHGPNSDFRPGFGFIFSLVIPISVWAGKLAAPNQIARLSDGLKTGIKQVPDTYQTRVAQS